MRAADYQDVAAIRDAALAAVSDSGAPGVRAEATVDANLRLPACPNPLRALPGQSGTVEVGCDAAGWRLFVPVRVRREQPVLVLTQSVAAGAVVSEPMVAVEVRDVARLSGGSLSDPAELAGRVARRALMAGSVLSPQDLISPRTIRRGDAVTVIARFGGIEVRALGKAMSDAGVDDRIAVQNLSSRRIVQGVVTEDGVVEVRR
ncbi:MAG: flagella basal body P-ring formation protein FlgA [Gammaproteobacteria bacterium HGW-Gammaproteobacteria-7]|nr:MAG: flagella basal body P-ring formation protein FlgA [Gammaproteobacteria bacterium HGW-Gammaproteobacteria-7]